jgi:hypothetical protein
MTDVMLVRRASAVTALVVCIGVGLMGCGGGGTTSASPATVTSASAPAGGQSTGTGEASSSSATESASGTAACERGRFALHAGLAAGAVHRYLWRPYQAGTFASGDPGRRAALTKGALAAGFAAYELRSAVQNIQGCPSVQSLVESVESGVRQLTALAAQARAGGVDEQSLNQLNDAVSAIEEKAKANGITVTEQEPTEDQLATSTTGP